MTDVGMHTFAQLFSLCIYLPMFARLSTIVNCKFVNFWNRVDENIRCTGCFELQQAATDMFVKILKCLNNNGNKSNGSRKGCVAVAVPNNGNKYQMNASFFFFQWTVDNNKQT